MERLGRLVWVSRLVWVGVMVLVIGLMSGCTVPQLRAEQRIFLPITLEFLSSYDLPPQAFNGAPVGGLSGLTYDRQRDRFYALSDDSGLYAPARFYTLKLTLGSVTTKPTIATIQIEGSTPLLTADGQPYAVDTINPEGIALSPQQSVYIASEGNSAIGVAPFVGEFDLITGKWKRNLPLPSKYLPPTEGQPAKGVENNAGFEALTVTPIVGNSPVLQEPFRLFTATEYALVQDQDNEGLDSDKGMIKNRLLHYLIQDGPPILISEHLYPMDRGESWSLMNGLTELIALDQSGHFLSLERSIGLKGFGARLFQISTGAATDVSTITSLKGNVSNLQPILKQLVLNLGELGIPVTNLEGMTLGPYFPDGSRSLVLVSDNNFKEQPTQFLLFRLMTLRRS
ncbi:MAG: esterase-like activity of phytase family protein [Cyanobacteria bacterium]|nr:esterase-like activity of phytase family protein [Cyanobacteriota bacterium]